MTQKNNHSPQDEVSPTEFALLMIVIGLIVSGFIEGMKFREPSALAGARNPTFVEMNAAGMNIYSGAALDKAAPADNGKNTPARTDLPR